MRRMRALARRAWAGPFAALFFMTGIAVPLMESTPPGDGPVAESQHAPDECVPGHDHSLCSVIKAGFVLPAPRAAVQSAGAGDAAPGIEPGLVALEHALADGHPPRAPPFV